jgi:hypothetical protein
MYGWQPKGVLAQVQAAGLLGDALGPILITLSVIKGSLEQAQERGALW